MDGPERPAHYYGSEGWGFESFRARHPNPRPKPYSLRSGAIYRQASRRHTAAHETHSSATVAKPGNNNPPATVTTTANRLPPFPPGSPGRGTDHDHLDQCNGLRRYEPW